MVWVSAGGIIAIGLLAVVGLVHVLAGFDRRQPGDLAGTVVRYEPRETVQTARRVVTLDRGPDGVYRAS